MSDNESGLSEAEARQVEEQSPPTAKVVHATVSAQGDDELDRPIMSLWWSALAAGIAIMASLHASGALRHYLPEARWSEAVVSMGYPIGFLIVILGRLQLFTEHTVLAVLPFARAPSVAKLGQVARLWAVVFAGNIAGAAMLPALCVFAHVQSGEVLAGMTAVSGKLLGKSALEIGLQGIPAGFLIASVAWIRAASADSGFAVVAVLTYAISLCGFTHVIAGATEAFLLLWTGAATPGWVFGGFLVPALLGNLVGGTGIFAVLAHAQVKEEL